MRGRSAFSTKLISLLRPSRLARSKIESLTPIERKSILIGAVNLLLETQIYLNNNTSNRSEENENRLAFPAIKTKQSSVAGAGNGVFLLQSMKHHRPVALYNGIYFPPPPVWALLSPDGTPVLSQHAIRQLIHSKAGTSSQYLLHLSGVGGSLDGDPCLFPPSPSPHYPAVAQLVNHPPLEKQPNVFSFPFMWREAIDAYSVEYSLPQKDYQALASTARVVNPVAEGPWYLDPTTLELVGHSEYAGLPAGCVFVTSTSIEVNKEGGEGEGEGGGREEEGGEVELLYDYHFNLSDPIPDWYSPVDQQ